MEVVPVALALGVLLSVTVGRGTLGRILDAPFRWVALALLGAAAQVVLGVWEPTSGWTEVSARTLHLGSYLALAVFCARNVHLTGMSVVLVGVLANATVVAVNGAMPVRVPADASAGERRSIELSLTRVAEDDADLAFLGEIIPLPGPVERSVSFGDLVLAAGLVDVVYRAGQRRRRARQPVAAAGASDPPAAVAPPPTAVAASTAGPAAG